MKNYTDSDYALNKINKDAIVYKFADGIVEVTLADYLAENPGKTEADFRALKKLSDADYFERDRKENAQTKRNTPFDELEETDLCYALSPEEIFFNEINAHEEAERHERRVKMVHSALDALTDTQRRRYLQYHVEGINEEKIAQAEGTTQQAVSKSLLSADRKIKKFLSATQK